MTPGARRPDRATGLAAWLLVALVLVMPGAWGESALDHARKHMDPTYTCPMHPHVRSDKPGNCPVCGMRLIPMERHVGEAGRVKLSPQQQRVLDVRTVTAREKPLLRHLKTVAEITYDERNLVEVTARVNGEVENYYHFFEGDLVEEGDVLIDLESPELMRVVQDYAQAMRSKGWVERLGSDMPHINATSTVTLLWRGLTLDDIKRVATSGELMKDFAIRTPVSGLVVEQNVNHGTLVNAGVQGGQFTAIGETIVKVAELSTVWVQAELLGPDLDRIETGDMARVRVHGLPARVFEAPVSFVYPVVDEGRRTRVARIVLPNEDLAMVPGMYADVTFMLPVPGTPAPPHRDLVGTLEAGEHEISGDAGTADVDTVLAIPASAVIDDGEGQFVFVKSAQDAYTIRPVELGAPAGREVPVYGGLHPGEEVVVQGQFFLQAEVVLRTSRGAGGHGGHDH